MVFRVDWRSGLSFTGTVVKWLSVPLILPLIISFVYGEDIHTFVFTAALVFVIGWLLERLSTERKLGAREALLMVATSWLAVSLVGSVPYLIAGHEFATTTTVPYVSVSPTESTLAHPVNAFFESMSGFTTTGATVMGDISFGTHSHALMMWRQLSQWLGGMGIIVLAIAILPEISVGGAQLMEAEAPGPGIKKLTPRIEETARVLWAIYIGFTALEMVLLYGLHLGGLAPDMTLYNAVAHGFTTLPTGGFSPEARSIEAFSSIVQWVIIPFMFVAGTNFALFWHVISGDFKVFATDSEYRFYLSVLVSLSLVTLVILIFTLSIGVLDSIRHAIFQVVSIVTTTGYASTDFNSWSVPAQYLLLAAMFIGGSAGSTGGSIKIMRWMVVLKTIKRELFTTVHPDAVRPVRLGDYIVEERAVKSIFSFTVFYVVIFFIMTLYVTVDTSRAGFDLSIVEAMSSVAATLGNVGPGLGAVGPMNNYLGFPATTKIVLSFLMWIGRLEILSVIVLFTPAYWRS